MVNPARVREVIGEVETGLIGLNNQIRAAVLAGEGAIRDTFAALEDQRRSLEQRLRQAEDDFYNCQRASRSKDESPNCNRYVREMEALQQQLYELSLVEKRFNEVVKTYEVKVSQLCPEIEKRTQMSGNWLRARQNALSQFDLSQGSVGRGRRSTSGGTFESQNQSSHGSRYQAARQTFLKGLINDANQPSYVRGWVQQELNRLGQVKQAKESGTTPPGGNTRHVRGIPGLDVGHRFPGIDVPANFRLEEAAMNRARPGIAKRLGVRHIR
jgi:hypothetical protein